MTAIEAVGGSDWESSSPQAVYSTLPAPSRAQHLWRYTPWHRIHPTGETSELPAAVAEPSLRLLLVDGTAPPAGVQLRMADIVDVDRMHGEVLDGGGDVAVALLRAVTDGRAHLLAVQRGTVLEQPLVLEIQVPVSVSALHLLVEVGDQAQVELITHVDGAAGWVGLLREGRVGRQARLSDLVIQGIAGDGRLLREEGWHVAPDGRLASGTLSVGGERAKTDWRAVLAGAGAEVNAHVAVHGQERRHDDHHVEIEHRGPHTTSRLFQHSAVDDRARAIGTAVLRIPEGCSGADAGQVFRSLLLSDKAHADAIPELEVETHDVAANHGAATGPIDPQQLFYLQSRGHDEQQAEHMIVEGFLSAAFAGLGSQAMQDTLHYRLRRHLGSE